MGIPACSEVRSRGILEKGQGWKKVEAEVEVKKDKAGKRLRSRGKKARQEKGQG